MDFAKIAANRGKLAPVPLGTQLPSLEVPVAGVQWQAEVVEAHPGRVVAVQIALTQRNDKLAGAACDTLNGKAHRLEVTRMGDFASVSQDESLQALLKHRVPQDGAGFDALRLPKRHSLLLEVGGPPGLKNLRAWTKAYAEIRRGVQWVAEALDVERGSQQYGLIAVLDVTPWTEKSWSDARGNSRTFAEAKVLGIGHLELVRLVSPTTQNQTEDAEDGDDEDYIPGFDD